MKKGIIKPIHAKTALRVRYAGGWLWQPERAVPIAITVPIAYVAFTLMNIQETAYVNALVY